MKPKVLIADDSALVLRMIEKMLAGKKAKIYSYVFLVVGEGIEKPGASVH